MRRLVLVLAATFCLALCAATAAEADVFGPIELVSAAAGSQAVYEQADHAYEPVVSGDGRYVAFAGSFGGVSGVWRRDLETGVVEQVAAGNATLPSISADGQYVSFTTNERLVPSEDRNQGPDVYRRDMALECTPGSSCEACPEPQGPETPGCPYAVVSAVNGGEEAPEYTFPAPTGELSASEETRFGSLADGRTAMSADGRYVAFVTTTGSNLLGAPTPALQVLLRDMKTHETKLVSEELGSGGPVQLTVEESEATRENSQRYGAVYPGGKLTPTFPPSVEKPWVGASISADGSTVTWMGQNINHQALLMPTEQGTLSHKLTEPLWRRIGEGPSTPTRRVTGGSDPTSPACIASGEQEVLGGRNASPSDPCAGPLGLEPQRGITSSEEGNFVPELSGNGEVVAFVSGARQLASGEIDREPEEIHEDLYVVNMAEGLTRVAATRRLTEKDGLGTTTEGIEKSGTITDYAVSEDGTQIAFTTERTLYPLLGSLTYVTAPAARAGMGELFDIDLADETLTRVTHGFAGAEQPSERPHVESPGSDPYEPRDGALYPSFSQSGNELGFSSNADNLAFGDGNKESDAFLVPRVIFAPQTVRQFVSAPPPPPAIVPHWRLDVTATSKRNGTVVLNVVVPTSGTLSATARTAVRVLARVSSIRARRGREALATRAVASAKTSIKGDGGLQTLTLTLSHAYLSLAAHRGGLAAAATVTFSTAGHAALRVSVPVSFHRTAGARR
ncbi:MAG TPA: hypothetical protein VGG08_05710 [Solirubrobacteraceae bacterium]|jgi:hypothetical protein